MYKPNIFLITVDQLRRDAIGVYGNDIVQTPNIDSLASGGVIFENHFIQNPLCMPSRWSIFTGRYPKNHGVRDNGVIFSKDEISLARVLKDEGYDTAAIGKMHLTPRLICKEEEDENWPDDDFSFSYKCLTDDAKKGGYLNYIKKLDKKVYDYVMKQGKEKVEEDLSKLSQRQFNIAPQLKESLIPYKLHQSSWIADRTIEYLEDSANAPFFMWCSFVDPHHPFDPPHPYDSMYEIEEIDLPVRRKNEFEDKPGFFKEMHMGFSPGNEKYDLSKITDLGWKTLISKYWGMVSLIDYNIGRIIKKLEEINKLDNTIIIFTADHGELLGDHRLLFKGPFHYDSLIHIPMIIKFGKAFCDNRNEKNISGLTRHIDIMPTILDYAGIKVPEGVQGRSLRSNIDGKSTQYSDYVLVDHNTGDWGFNVKTLRSKEFRMTYYAEKDYGELYDLKKDPGELYNLWNDNNYKNIRDELTRILLDTLIGTEDIKNTRLSSTDHQIDFSLLLNHHTSVW